MPLNIDIFKNIIVFLTHFSVCTMTFFIHFFDLSFFHKFTAYQKITSKIVRTGEYFPALSAAITTLLSVALALVCLCRHGGYLPHKKGCV